MVWGGWKGEYRRQPQQSLIHHTLSLPEQHFPVSPSLTDSSLPGCAVTGALPVSLKQPTHPIFGFVSAPAQQNPLPKAKKADASWLERKHQWGWMCFPTLLYAALQPKLIPPLYTIKSSNFQDRRGLVAQGCKNFCPRIFTGTMAWATGSPSHDGILFYFWQPLLRERSLMHPKPSSNKPAASQGRQKSILFCFHPFSQRACAELTDMWISPRRVIPRTLLLNIAGVVGGCKRKWGIWNWLVNSCLGTN